MTEDEKAQAVKEVAEMAATDLLRKARSTADTLRYDSEVPYQNREIKEMFGDVKDSLLRIETQTSKTNGRVTKLEKWQNWVLGFCAAISIILISVVIPLAFVIVKVKTQ
jgi:hypothetical protein